MLNPNDIANHKFDKSMGRGYKADEVDNYLAQLSSEVGALLAEKRDIEQKMMVLADKLEEYKDDEESLRSALIGAQKLGDSVVREAKLKAAATIEDAQAQAALIIDNARQAVEREKNGFIRMQREVATFKSKLQLLYKQHLELISTIPVDDSVFAPQAPAVPKPVPDPVPEEPEESYADPADIPLPQDEELYPEDLPEPDALDYTEEPLAYEEDPLSEPEPARRESRFGPLKFGKEYDIKRDDGKRKK